MGDEHTVDPVERNFPELQVARGVDARIDEIKVRARGDHRARSCARHVGKRRSRSDQQHGELVGVGEFRIASGEGAVDDLPEQPRVHGNRLQRDRDQRRKGHDGSNADQARCVSSFLQSVPLQSPQKHIETILPEEGFAFERHGRHAPVAGCKMRLLVLKDDRFVLVRPGGNLSVEFGEIEPGARGGLRQMIALAANCRPSPTRSCD